MRTDPSPRACVSCRNAVVSATAARTPRAEFLFTESVTARHYGIATGAHSTYEMLAAGAEAAFNSLIELKAAFGL